MDDEMDESAIAEVFGSKADLTPAKNPSEVKLPSLHRSLFIYMIMVSVIPLAVVGALAFGKASELIEDGLHREISDLAQYTRLRVHQHIDVTEVTAQLANKLVTTNVVSMEDREQLKRLFLSHLEEHPQLRNVYLGYPDGSFLLVGRDKEGFLSERVAVASLPHAFRHDDALDGKPETLGYDPKKLAPLEDLFPFEKDRQAPVFKSMLTLVANQVRALTEGGQPFSKMVPLVEQSLQQQVGKYPFANAVYVGFPDGTFVSVTRAADQDHLGEWRKFDPQGDQIQTRHGEQPWLKGARPDDHYDPRSRPWYTSAMAAGDNIAWTDVYRSHPSGNPCVTAAVAVRSSTGLLLAVVGFDFEFNAFVTHPWTKKLLVPPRAVAVLVERLGPRHLKWLPAESKIDFYDPTARGWWKAKDKEGNHWTGIYLFASSKLPGLTVARALREAETDGLRGVLGVDIDVFEVSRFLRQIQADHSRNGRSIRAFVADGSGIIVGHPEFGEADRLEPARRTVAEVEAGRIPAELITKTLASVAAGKGDGDPQTISFTTDSGSYLAKIVPIAVGNTSWSVWVIADREVFVGHLYRGYLLLLVLGLIAVAMSIRVAYRLRRQVAQPISNVAASLERVGDGHYFDKDLEQKVYYRELKVLSDGFQSMLHGLQEHYHLRRYVSKATMDSVEAHREETTQVLGGARAVRTIWFSDIRGFTAFSELHSPEQVISVLNRYFRIEAEQIEAFGGDIDKFIGDGVMATFEGPDQVGRAVQASLAILDAFRAYNEKHGASITIGIGINTGDVVVGNMGAGRRMDFTCLGDNVNIAARLCDKAEPYQLLLSEPAFREVRDRTQNELLEPVSVKGKKEALVVYSVTAWTAG